MNLEIGGLRFANGGDDGAKLVCFGQDVSHFCFRKNVAVGDELQPVESFIDYSKS
ncbi:MAG: hypothetical protein IKA23_06430 [Akkermansia sp.]|nr:hypothetical protein [Akkermansia sp.]MBR2313859.1 hypothetical protein [Akkermansia sp.]